MDNKSIRLIISITLNALIIIAGVYIIFAAGNKAYSFGHNIFNEEAVSSAEDARQVEITIATNETSKSVAKALYAKGLVKDETIAYLQIMLSDYKDKFKPGTYLLDTSMTPSEMFAVMCSDTGEDEE
jgi:UPF0755 protein